MIREKSYFSRSRNILSQGTIPERILTRILKTRPLNDELFKIHPCEDEFINASKPHPLKEESGLKNDNFIIAGISWLNTQESSKSK